LISIIALAHGETYFLMCCNNHYIRARLVVNVSSVPGIVHGFKCTVAPFMGKSFYFSMQRANYLKGHSHEKAFEIIPLNHRLGPK
jgi:hypothetical protein